MTAVRYSVSAGVATLTMDQPKNRNALTPALLNGLGDGLEAAGEDPEVRAVLLTHTGPTFCAGADLKRSGEPSEKSRFELAEVLLLIQESPKPVVARIAGHCIAGGVGLAAACDLSIASDNAQLGFSEVRIGVAPAIISVVCLPKLRRSEALELFLTGERITAIRAAEAGLITAAVPAEQLDDATDVLLEKLKAGAPEALTAAKRLVFDVPSMERRDAFSQMSELSQRLFASAEAAEGMAAFREKRRPAWDRP